MFHLLTETIVDAKCLKKLCVTIGERIISMIRALNHFWFIWTHTMPACFTSLIEGIGLLYGIEALSSRYFSRPSISALFFWPHNTMAQWFGRSRQLTISSTWVIYIGKVAISYNFVDSAILFYSTFCAENGTITMQYERITTKKQYTSNRRNKSKNVCLKICKQAQLPPKFLN